MEDNSVMSTTKTTKTANVDAKVADKAAEVKTTAAKKTEEVKKEAVKAEPAKKAAKKTEEVKKETAAKKEPAKKAVKEEPAKAEAKKAAPAKKEAAAKKTEEVYIEFGGSQISTTDIVAKVVEATGKKASAIKTLNVYVQPEFGVAYYTADGTEGKINY